MRPLIQKAALFLCFTALAMYAYVTYHGPHGIPALSEKRRQIVALQEENATLSANNRKLADYVEKLGKDKNTQQKKIRERLKLLQPGETQLMLPGKTLEQKSE
jgi:cell division protein FtsB